MIVFVLLAMFWGPTVIGLLFGPRRGRRSVRLPRFRRVTPAPAPPAQAPATADASPSDPGCDPLTLPADSLQWSALDDRQLMRYLAGSAQ
jgi:hypothetical protein